jgi:hypothetical protein
MENKQDSLVSRVGFEPTTPAKTLLNQRDFEDSSEYLRNIASVESVGVTQSLRGWCFFCESPVAEAEGVIGWGGRLFCSEACNSLRVQEEAKLDRIFRGFYVDESEDEA